MTVTDSYIRNLGAQLEVYRAILDGAKRQQKAIVDADTQTLEGINAELRELESRAKALEADRDALDGSGAVKTISQLSAATDPARAHVIDTLGNQLRLVIVEISDTMALNSELLSIHFDIVDKLAETITKGVKTNTLYGASGLEQDENTGYMSIINTQI